MTWARAWMVLKSWIAFRRQPRPLPAFIEVDREEGSEGKIFAMSQVAAVTRSVDGGSLIWLTTEVEAVRVRASYSDVRIMLGFSEDRKP